MSAYTQPILRFGLITPLMFNGLLLAAAAFGYNKVASIRNSRETLYREYTARMVAIKGLEEKIAPQRKQFEEQRKLLQTDPGPLFTQILDTVLPKYTEFELERVSLVFPLERGRLGKMVQSELARVKCTFEGGIGPMQETLLQVEALMPQAQLEEMKITRKPDPFSNRPDHLIIDTTHTCWKAGETKP
ncbi:MAG: hypothetical protein EOP86_02265 [Verrucomicrobiaceae bacterium]|nr:MAG: hypothetical protein EOP86_02265 [Verrucomicrobiaceae bacterium]